MPSRVTLRDLAKAVGVHYSTVSLALRNDRRVRPETQMKIQAAARSLGYRPDPMLAALSAYRHERKLLYHGTIGYLLTEPHQAVISRNDGSTATYRGATEQAEKLGFKLDPIDISVAGITDGRITKILEARGIRGLILSPLKIPGEYPKLPWDRFCVVAIGYSIIRPAFHRVCHHQTHSMQTLLRELRSLGYRRIGFIISRPADLRTGHNFLGAYLAEQVLQPVSAHVTPYVPEESATAEEVAAWLRAEEPDCVACCGVPEVELVRAARPKGHDAPQVALITKGADASTISGMDERWDAVGATAVDMVVALLKTGDCGVPTFPRFALVEGRWVPEKTRAHARSV